jgi:hypothetical protein
MTMRRPRLAVAAAVLAVLAGGGTAAVAVTDAAAPSGGVCASASYSVAAPDPSGNVAVTQQCDIPASALPGPTTTVPGPTSTVPGPTTTVPGPTTTAPGPTVTVTATATATASTSPPPPPAGVLWGAAVGGNSSPSVLEQPAGRPIGVHRTYWNADQVTAAVASAQADVTAGRVPWPSFKLPPVPAGSTAANPWAYAATGGDDPWAKDLYARLAALNRPVMLTFHHEPEGDYTPISDFVKMSEHLYQLKPAGTQIKVGPILSMWDELFAPTQDPANYGQYAFAKLFPNGFHAGDFLGGDAYLTYGTPKNGKWWFIGATYWKPWSDYAKSQGVGWAVGEFGISHDAAAYNRTITTPPDVSWLREADTSAVNLGGCLALAYFDSNLNSVSDWRLETDPGTPSKLSVWVDILKHSPAAPTSW